MDVHSHSLGKTRTVVHWYSLEVHQQYRKCLCASPKIGVTHWQWRYGDNFYPHFQHFKPKAMGAPSGPSTTFMWIYCTSLCYFHQLQPFNRRAPKSVTIFTHIDLWAISSGCVYLIRNRLMPAGDRLGI